MLQEIAISFETFRCLADRGDATAALRLQPSKGTPMDEPKPLSSAFSKTANFSIRQVDGVFRAAAHAAAVPAAVPLTLPPSLGPLAAFAGTFSGLGFNTIFRPDSA